MMEKRTPIVVACTGHAIAQGAAYLMSADVRVGAAGDFRMGLKETQIDMVLRRFGPTLAKARLNRRFWMRAAVLGEVFDPETAIAVEYLDSVVSPEALLETAMEKAAQL